MDEDRVLSLKLQVAEQSVWRSQVSIDQFD